MEQQKKGQWGNQFGFLMAAVGSAVGLGNLWAFPYKMGKNGGFAFLFIYIIIVAFVGIIITITELGIGRKTGKGVVGAYRELGKKFAPIGWFGVISPFLIMSFYMMLGGYTLKYMIANLGDIFGASWGYQGAGMETAEYFQAFFSNQLETVIYTVIFVLLTAAVVRGGVSEGIEKFSKVAMPALFFMLVAVIIRSVTLPGALEGLKFVFEPNFEVFKGSGWVNVFAAAGGQAFFSLSLGMGIMVTYGSYLKKEEDLKLNSIVIPIADTIIAVMAGMAIMPAVFAGGLEPAAGPGLLFVTLQTVFASMGAGGPIFGFVMYFLVFIAAITSSISLLETVVAVVVDMKIEKSKEFNKKKITFWCTAAIMAEAIFVSLDGLGSHGFPQIFGQSTWLDSMDLVSEGVLMPLSALLTAIICGWVLPEFVTDEVELNGKFTWKKFYMFCIRFVVPPVMILVLLGQLDSFFKLGIFG